MPRGKIWRGVCGVLNATVTTVLCFALGYLLLERWAWQTEMYGNASGLGHMHAKDAYRRGEFRILELAEDGDYAFTGRLEDGFEVWTWATYSGFLAAPFRTSAKHYVEGYNRAMRNLVSKMGFPHTPIEKRIDELKSEHTMVRFRAAEALGMLGPQAKQAVPALAEALKDEDAGVQVAAALALPEMGPAAKEAVPALTEALKDSDPTVRQYAERALEKIGRE